MYPEDDKKSCKLINCLSHSKINSNGFCEDCDKSMFPATDGRSCEERTCADFEKVNDLGSCELCD